MNQKQLRGKIGEIKAAMYLQKHGYSIICTNFRCMQGEIDIIAKKNDVIVFVEVKTRTSQQYGKPADAVNKIKQKHIVEAASYFLYKNKMEDIYSRIDVIEVYLYNR